MAPEKTVHEMELRAHTVSTRLSEAEWTRWKAAASEDRRQRLGQWVRESIERMLDGQMARHDAKQSRLTEVHMAELRRQGQNLNQIARAFNQLVRTSDRLQPNDLRAAHEALIETRSEHRRLSQIVEDQL